MNPVSNFSRSLLTVIFLLMITGCDNTLQPLNKEDGIYSIYGILNLRLSTNYIRVKNLNIPLVDDTTRELNATVMLQNLITGQSQRLTDSTITYDGVITHNFRTTLPLIPETEYKVTVQRQSDDREVTAQTITPIISKVDVEPRTGNCKTYHEVIYHPVAPEGGIQTTVEFEYDGEPTRAYKPLLSSNKLRRIVQYYQPAKLICRLKPATEECFTFTEESPCRHLTSPKFNIFYTHYGPGYKNSTTSDSLNITNGAGHFISLYRDTTFFSVAKKFINY